MLMVLLSVAVIQWVIWPETKKIRYQQQTIIRLKTQIELNKKLFNYQAPTTEEMSRIKGPVDRAFESSLPTKTVINTIFSNELPLTIKAIHYQSSIVSTYLIQQPIKIEFSTTLDTFQLILKRMQSMRTPIQLEQVTLIAHDNLANEIVSATIYIAILTKK